MKSIYDRQIAILLVLFAIFFYPSTTYAANLKLGSIGDEVSAVQNVLKNLGYLDYSDINSYFGDKTEEAVKDFQKDNKLAADGIVGQNTAKALNLDEDVISKIVSNSKLGDLDWFSKVQYIFERGKDAYVTDLDTGKSFYVKRTFGTNHADVEPLTQEDSDTIRDIWGGWSWERRAVIVKVEDTIIAGSMTAFPHAGLDSEPAVKIVNNRSGNYGRGQNLDSIKNNGIDGHMDIHFLNSRTHGTNVVQKSHQNMVKKAAQYIYENY